MICCPKKKTLTNMKAGSRGIYSCRCFSVQQSTMPQRSEGRVPTEFLFACFDGDHEVSNPGRSRVLFEWHRVACRENGDVELLLSADVELHLSARPTLTTPRGSRFLGPLWVQMNSCRKQRVLGWRRRTRPCGRTPSLQCAGPRCYHTSAPKQSAENASGHDDGMWKALEGLFGRQTGNHR